MKKYITITLLIGLIAFMFAGCGASEYEIQGKENAKKYIEEKYGFEPTVKSVTSQRTNNSPVPFVGTTSDTGFVYVKMEYNDESFYVFISGMSQNTDGRDNYQIKEIEDDVIKMVNDKVSGVIHVDCFFGNAKESVEDPYYGMLPIKYDGNNLIEVLHYMPLSQIVVSLVGADLSSITEEFVDETFGFDSDVLFVNYKSHDDYKKAENTTYGLATYKLSNGIEENDAYIVEYKEF